MRTALVAGAALIACLALARLQPPPRSRALAGAVVLAAFLRFGLAALIAWSVNQAALRNGARLDNEAAGMGVWLDDEAAAHWATLALLPHPLEQALPEGLRHLGGNPYLGLTTLLYLALGPDPGTLRVANAALGVVCVLLVWRIAYLLLGPRRAPVAALAAACWPPLVLWSATILRDTLVALAVLAAWWATLEWRSGRRPLALCTSFFALSLLVGLRSYVFVLALLGLAACAAYPALRRRSRLLGIVALSVGGLAVAAALLRPAPIHDFLHSIAYRQAATRLETLGKLHVPNPEPRPYGRGEMVLLRESPAGRELAGVIQEHGPPGTEMVAFTDRTTRAVATRDLVPFREARVPIGLILAGTIPQALAVLVGYSDISPSAPVSLAWVADALAWDVLLVLGMVGIWRSRAAAPNDLFPLVMVIGTMVALAALPGAPGNAARHRAVQAAPSLIVLAAGLWPARPSRSRPLLVSGTQRAAISPAIATGPASSRSRSDR